ncbi:MAG: hypothetical protein U0V48_17205 [Anaerolineales bacterium]
MKVNAQWKVEKYLEELKGAKGRLETLKSSRLSADYMLNLMCWQPSS